MDEQQTTSDASVTTSPMRIVYVSWEYPPDFGGGIGTFVDAASRAMARRGHEVTVVAATRGAVPLRERRDNLDVIRLPWPQCGGPEPGATLSSWQVRSEQVSGLLQKMINGPGVDLIEFGDYRGEGFAFLHAVESDKRPVCIMRLHTPLCVLDKYNASSVHQPVLSSFELQAIDRVDRIVSPSAALAKEMQMMVPNLPPVDVSPHPVDPAFLRFDLENAPEEVDEILYVGRLEQRKGVEILIEAMPQFFESCPTAKLVMIGGDMALSPTQPSTKAVLLDRLPSQYHDRVEIPGPIPHEQLIERYLRAKLSVFPSLFENFPNTCLEAMALGRCVVGTSNSGMAEMITDGATGFITQSGDVVELSTMLTHVFQMPLQQRRDIGLAARERIRELYSPEIIGQNIEHQYAQYVSKHTGVRPNEYSHQKPPKVAIVIPCYNHGRFLKETLESVDALAYDNVECVIVDDGSTDSETIRILGDLEKHGRRILFQENKGLSGARNTGVRATDAEFFIPLDADDRLAPNFIDKLLPVLQDDSTLGYAYSHVQFFDADNGTWECPDYHPHKLLVQNLSVATALIRRSAYDLVGGYQTDMVFGFEDWDFWLALLATGYYGQCVPEPLFFYRKHANGSMLSDSQRHRAEMVGKMIEHHRGLFVGMLEMSMAEKDRMFFEAHTEAWQLRQAIAAGNQNPTRSTSVSTVDNEVYQRLLAEAELDYIGNSRTWRTVQSLKRNCVYNAMARLRWGPNWREFMRNDDPRVELTRIKNSLAYRTIQGMKKLPVYRWYARKKYGSNWNASIAENAATENPKANQ